MIKQNNAYTYTHNFFYFFYFFIINNFGPKSVEQLISFLKENKTLTELHISGNINNYYIFYYT